MNLSVQQATLALLSCECLETLGQALCECILQWAPEAYLIVGYISPSKQDLTCYSNGKGESILTLQFDDFSHPFAQVMRTGKSAVWSTLNYGVRIEHPEFRALVQNMGKECGLSVQPFFDSQQRLVGVFAIFDMPKVLNSLMQPEHAFLYLLQVYLLQVKNLKKTADLVSKNNVRYETSYVQQVEKNNMSHVVHKAFVGRSSYVCQLRKKVQVAITHEAPISIEGESGSGKSRLAVLLHTLSGRKGALVIVDCNSLDIQQQGRRLFGADNVSESALIEANNGTLLLENIDQLAPCWYGRLQHALDCGEVHSSQKYDFAVSQFRMLTTSCQSLLALAATVPSFHSLYLRLNHYPLMLQPLRCWREDLELLAQNIISELCQQHHRPVFVIPNEWLAPLHGYHFPGNILELKTLLEILILEYSDAELSAVHEILAERLTHSLSTEPIAMPDYTQSGTLKEVISVFEKAVISHRLIRKNSNKERVANSLAISRRSLDMKCKKLGLSK